MGTGAVVILGSGSVGWKLALFDAIWLYTVGFNTTDVLPVELVLAAGDLLATERLESDAAKKLDVSKSASECVRKM